MNLISHCCLCLSLCFLISCGSSRKESTEVKKNDGTQQNSKPPQDTMPDVPIADPAPAPGTVELKGKVLVHDINNESKSAPHINMQVLEVFGYGAATPPLAPDDTVEVSISKRDTVLKTGVIFKGMIHIRKVMAQFEEKTPVWQLVKFSIKN